MLTPTRRPLALRKSYVKTWHVYLGVGYFYDDRCRKHSHVAIFTATVAVNIVTWLCLRLVVNIATALYETETCDRARPGWFLGLTKHRSWMYRYGLITLLAFPYFVADTTATSYKTNKKPHFNILQTLPVTHANIDVNTNRVYGDSKMLNILRQLLQQLGKIASRSMGR